jgi:hypothetical protein
VEKSVCGLQNNSNGLETLAHNECNGDMLTLANKINNFFQSVSSHFTPLEEFPHTMANEIPNDFIISVESVEKQLCKLNTNKAPGPDGIPTWLFRELPHIFAGPICSIYNSSFKDSFVPGLWKTANTCALPKSSPPLNLNKDLRPISLTPILSKGIETYARDWLLDFFKPSLDTTQYGSQKECSTTMALAHLIHSWLLNLDNSGSAIRILLLDFSKAFDLVDHSILVNKITNSNTPTFLSNWIRSFLCNRKQRVKINNTLSEWANIHGGVPQGTILGPLTFLIHINDLNTCCNSIKYVDDTTLWESCNLAKGDSNIQHAANEAMTWCKSNNMKINTDKTKEMVIYFGRSNFSFPLISMNDSELERVSNTKLLGVILNNKLTWGDHIDYICKKASQRLFFIRLLKKANVPLSDIVLIYCSIVRAILEYACEVWHHSLTKRQTDSLEHIQKRALKIVSPNNEYKDALKMFNIESLHERREEKCIKFFKDICNPNHKLHFMLPPKNTIQNLRSKRTFQLPKVKTKRLKHSPIFYGIFNYQHLL